MLPVPRQADAVCDHSWQCVYILVCELRVFQLFALPSLLSGQGEGGLHSIPHPAGPCGTCMHAVMSARAPSIYTRKGWGDCGSGLVGDTRAETGLTA